MQFWGIGGTSHMGNEKVLQNKAIKYLKERSIYYIKVHNNGYMRKGIPDLIICYGGQFIAVELKSLQGKVSSSQAIELDAIVRSNGQAYVINSIEEFTEIFK